VASSCIRSPLLDVAQLVTFRQKVSGWGARVMTVEAVQGDEVAALEHAKVGVSANR
jgi:hypothetical protein